MSTDGPWAARARAAADCAAIPEHLWPVVTTSGTIPIYPCDRGIPNAVTGRGWHHFEASPNGVVVCRYCGRKP